LARSFRSPLETLDVAREWTDATLSLSGDRLTYSFDCEDVDELVGMLTALKWVYPSLLNLEFADPPLVLAASGKVGATRFRWEHEPEEWQLRLRPVTAESLQAHAVESFEQLSLFNGAQNRRLAAALLTFTSRRA
jgi:hypothetical protein